MLEPISLRSTSSANFFQAKSIAHRREVRRQHPVRPHSARGSPQSAVSANYYLLSRLAQFDSNEDQEAAIESLAVLRR